MDILGKILCLFLIGCALSVCLSKKLLTSLIIFMAYSLIVSVIWILLESPDLSITEAAVGAGVTGVLFFVTYYKIRLFEEMGGEECDEKDE